MSESIIYEGGLPGSIKIMKELQLNRAEGKPISMVEFAGKSFGLFLTSLYCKHNMIVGISTVYGEVMLSRMVEVDFTDPCSICPVDNQICNECESPMELKGDRW